jgi:CelD/BcsL family acetyltransferase involved in cellulose biosynthesis
MTGVVLKGLVGGDTPWAIEARGATGVGRSPAEIRTGSSSYRELRDDWRRLGALQRGPVLFQSPELLEIWARHFAAGRGHALATVVVRGDDGRPALIWPLFVERIGLVRVARGAGAPFGQYDEILLDPDCDGEAALKAAIAALRRELRIDLIVLERVRADGALHAAIGEPPLASIEAAPFSDLSQGVDAHIAGLKSRVVRQQRKRVRRFAQEGAVSFRVAETADQAVGWLGEAMQLKRDWLRKTGRVSRAFVKPETVDHLADCARKLSRPGAEPRMVVSKLTLNGRTAAIEAGFVHRGVYHLYLGAFAEEVGRFGPGNILTEEILRWCAENGVARYDMLAPRSRNKSEWQSGEVAVSDFALPTTQRGRLYVALVLRRLVPALRRAFYRLPARLRSMVAGVALEGGESDAAPDGGGRAEGQA